MDEAGMFSLLVAVREESQSAIPTHPRRVNPVVAVRKDTRLQFAIHDKTWTAEVYSASLLKQLLRVLVGR